MEILHGACVIGQSGGPTSVINACALGIIETSLRSANITRVLAAQNGIVGILNDDLFDLNQESDEELKLLTQTPSSILGSCRHKMPDPDFDDSEYCRILEIFKKYDIKYFFYIGGNDSMDTCNKVSKYMEKSNYPCRIIGVPKTIDNDLIGTDHCPGYGSAARFIATTCAELRQDTNVYPTPTVNVVEIMGRHAGWLAAASSLACVVGQGPDLIYLPERNFSLEQFLSDVHKVVSDTGYCLVAVSEGIHYADGSYINDVKKASADGFGHVQLGGLSSYLANIITQRLGYKSRGIELSLPQRCAAHCASQTDVGEAYQVGATAVEAALNGATDQMIGFQRIENDPYKCVPVMVALDTVANQEKKVPDKWINETGNGIMEDFIQYALPLIQGVPQLVTYKGLPCYANLKRIKPDSIN